MQQAAGPRRNREELVANGCSLLKAELFKWYDAYTREHPGERFSRLGAFTVQTLGDQDSMQLKTKAAETRPLVFFCAWLLERHSSLLKGDEEALVPACKALVQFIELMRGSPQRLSTSQRQEMHDCYKRYLLLSSIGGVPQTPKVHLAMHMLDRTRAQGNPRFYATFADESANGTARDLASGLHARTWAVKFHSYWKRLQHCAGKRPLD